MGGKRCICGQSRRMPLCDGAHQSLSWQCGAAQSTVHTRVFAAAPHNQNIAERLAHAQQGVALHQVPGRVRAEQVVVISDGSDVDALTVALQRVDAQQQRVILMGGEPSLMQAIFPHATVEAVADTEDVGQLWQGLQAALHPSVEQPPRVQRPPPLLFVSHATADEPVLQAPTALLRRLGISLFVCGDSIAGGSRWWEEILDALRRCDRFVLVLSASSRQSQWCAFEVGAAVALHKPIQVISLDGNPPPSFVGHLQMSDIPRACRQRPWLRPCDAIVEALVSGFALSGAS